MYQMTNIKYKTRQRLSNYVVFGVRFRNSGTIYDFKSTIPLKVGDKCIVETKNGEEFGIISSTKRKITKGRTRRPLNRVLRKATEIDIMQVRKNISLEREANRIYTDIIRKKKLKMNLVSVKFSFDSQRAIFYLTGEGRLDFKGAIKELANHFNIRIEMKQIGMRDSARLHGGCGLCGKILCCSSFLKGFQPVSIKMAKEQKLALSPMKISGICGRLLCCLVFEHKTYKELNKKLPKCGECVRCSHGVGKVIKRDILQEEVEVQLEDEEKRVKVNVSDIAVIKTK